MPTLASEHSMLTVGLTRRNHPRELFSVSDPKAPWQGRATCLPWRAFRSLSRVLVVDLLLLYGSFENSAICVRSVGDFGQRPPETRDVSMLEGTVELLSGLGL